MPWGSGQFNRVYGATGWTDDKLASTFIVSSRHDTHDQDLADGINACITRDNQAKPTADFAANATNSFNLGTSAVSWKQLFLGTIKAAVWNDTNSILGYFGRTAAELAASVTPTNYFQYPGQAYRQYINTTPGTTNTVTGFQAAVDAASALNPAVTFQETNAFNKPLLIRSTTIPNLVIDGQARVTSILVPLAANIATAPVSINAMVINQHGSGQAHFHLNSMRFGPDAVAFTGNAIYCKAGGGADASVQALFSSSFDDIWFGFSANNSGYCRGGFSNLSVTRTVAESSKTGVFILEGSGNGDQQYRGNVMNNSYDQFINADNDTIVKAIISSNMLHAYQHNRGALYSITKGYEMVFNDTILEPIVGNVGSTGLYNFTDCLDVIATSGIASTANGAPKCAAGIRIVNGHTGKYANHKIAATLGVEFLGTGALDVTFDNCDFIGCDTAVQWTSGTLSGKILFRGCRLNDNQLYGMITAAGTHSWDLTMIDCEIVNCGLDGTVTNRNFDLTTSGKVKLIRCKIGQDNASAAAAFYIRANGAGTFEVIDPIVVGAAPTNFNTGAQAITFDGVDSETPSIKTQYPCNITPGGTVVLATQQFAWSIKSRRYYFSGRLTITTIGTGSQTTLSGLPFASHGTNYGAGTVPFFQTSATALTTLGFTVAPGGTSLILRSLVAAAVSTGNSNVMQNGTDLILEGSYPLP